MFGKSKSEVLIAGAGPVGLFAAAEMVRRGLDVHIVDGASRGTGMSYALALHPGSLELMEDLGLAAAAADAGYRVKRIAFYEGTERRAEVDLGALTGGYPFLTILPQSSMEGSLERWLKGKGVNVRWRHRVAGVEAVDGGQKVRLEKWGEDSVGYAVAHEERVIEKISSFDTRFIVGADGHSSVVRRLLDIDYPQLAEPDLFAVFEFHTKTDMEHEARVILNDDSTNVLWPLPGGRCRWSFQLNDAESVSGERVKSRLSALGRWILPYLDRDKLDELIAERAPWFSGGVDEIIWSVAIRFERRLAAGFGRDGMWLAGDSAHLASPVGMHSMNVGLREARDLAVAFEKVLRQGESESTLDAYSQERQVEWRRLLGLDDSYMVAGDASPFATKNAARIVSSMPASGEALDLLLGQVGISLGG